jgi:hypothetical protein
MRPGNGFDRQSCVRCKTQNNKFSSFNDSVGGKKMTTKRAKTKMLAGLLTLLALSAFSVFVMAGGALEPSAAPGVVMKTLDEVEPRVPVQSLPGDANSLHVINEPGSYYLTDNITGVSDKNGIEIASDNVTLDLKGFALIGVPGSGDGITCV